MDHEHEEDIGFPGYAEETNSSISGKRGIAPIKRGPVTITISYVHTAISVAIHVAPIGGFSGRSFRTITISPSHAEDSAHLTWGSTIEMASASVTLKLNAKKRAVHVAVTTTGVAYDAVGNFAFNVTYVDGNVKFPNFASLEPPKFLNHDQLQHLLDDGTWRTLAETTSFQSGTVRSFQSAGMVETVLTMLGAGSMISEIRQYIRRLAGVSWQRKAAEHDQSNVEEVASHASENWLVAIGLEGDGDYGVVAGQIGFGIYITDSDVGFYQLASIGIGEGLEIAAQGIVSVYIGHGEVSALDVFNGAAVFCQASAAYGLEGELRFAFVLNEHHLPQFAGVAIGLGAGAGGEVSGGALTHSATSFIRKPK